MCVPRLPARSQSLSVGAAGRIGGGGGARRSPVHIRLKFRLDLVLVVFGYMLVWSEALPSSSSGKRRSAAVLRLVLAVWQHHVGSEASTSPSISSIWSLIWKDSSPSSSASKTKDLKMEQRRSHVPVQVRDPLSPDFKLRQRRSLGDPPGDRWADFAAPVTFLVEGRPLSSSFSPVLGAQQRRSLGVLPLGGGWADCAVPVTLRAEGRPCADSVPSDRKPSTSWRDADLEAFLLLQGGQGSEPWHPRRPKRCRPRWRRG